MLTPFNNVEGCFVSSMEYSVDILYSEFEVYEMVHRSWLTKRCLYSKVFLYLLPYLYLCNNEMIYSVSCKATILVY